MTDTTNQPARPARTTRRQRTWTAFGDIRRRPSDYKIGTQGVNYTLRAGRKAPFEQNPSSPGNMWMRAYREQSPLQADEWETFREPDSLTYRAYVTHQNEQETQVAGVLEQYAAAGLIGGPTGALVGELEEGRARSILEGVEPVDEELSREIDLSSEGAAFDSGTD